MNDDEGIVVKEQNYLIIQTEKLIGDSSTVYKGIKMNWFVEEISKLEEELLKVQYIAPLILCSVWYWFRPWYYELQDALSEEDNYVENHIIKRSKIYWLIIEFLFCKR